MSSPLFTKPTAGLAGKAMLFLLLFGVFNAAYQNGRDGMLQHLLIDRMTVSVSAWLIGQFTPQEGVSAQGHRLISPGVRLSVLNGCEGTEAMLLLCAALLVYPMAWWHRLQGIAIGVLLIYMMNQARIVALYYCLRYDRPLFETLHGYLAPTVVVLLTVLFFMYWIAHANQQADS
jgi:exosortase family protein XrtM